MFKGLQTPIDEQGPVAEAQRDLQKGDFSSAITELTKLTENFDKMDKKDQEKAQQQMKQMAQQLQQMANNPPQQQQMTTMGRRTAARAFVHGMPWASDRPITTSTMR